MTKKDLPSPTTSHYEQTNPNSENTAQTYDINGPATPNTVNLYREIFRKIDVELVSHNNVTDPRPVTDPRKTVTEPRP